MEKLLIYGGIALGAVIASTLYGAYKAYVKIRENERIADAKREEEIEKRVSVAERASDNRVSQLQEIADGWREMAQLKSQRITELESKLREVSKDLQELERKYDRLTELYTESQTALSSLQKQFNAMTSR